MQQQDDVLAESFNFNIFDGCPDEDSPWARFIDTEEIDDDEGEEQVEESYVEVQEPPQPQRQ
ncbi:MAG: hypothetical protein ACPHI1_05155, partial [Candidatus Puniceispirillaceae bacterium]